jgi:hypothetical protein
MLGAAACHPIAGVFIPALWMTRRRDGAPAPDQLVAPLMLASATSTSRIPL